jgi:hypothetical protein
MKVTTWTNEEYARKHYIDPFVERLNLMNPNKKMITPNELKTLAKENNLSNDEMYKKWEIEYDKIPMWLDEDKVKEYESILSEMETCVIEHCKEKGIRFSANYHQYGDYGVPIIDDKYMFFTFARTWGYIMAMTDDDKSDNGYLKYYLHGNKYPTKYPNEVKGEVCL